jgi:hypothetical protein
MRRVFARIAIGAPSVRLASAPPEVETRRRAEYPKEASRESFSFPSRAGQRGRGWVWRPVPFHDFLHAKRKHPVYAGGCGNGIGGLFRSWAHAKTASVRLVAGVEAAASDTSPPEYYEPS